MDLLYSSEKLSQAAHGLAISTKSIQGRVADVMSVYLDALIDHQSLPPDLHARLKDYCQQWEKADQSIPCWAEQLTDDEASLVARWIVDTRDEVDRLFSEEQAHQGR